MPVSVMVWSVYDPVIEDRHLLESQFSDLLAKEFNGLAVWVRCSRYAWDHPEAIAALQHISKLCDQNEIACWLGLDPRFISRKLIQDESGIPIVLYGDDVRATRTPNFSPVIDGKYNVRCTVAPRHTHMLNEVAVEFYPVGVLKAYAIRKNQTEIAESDVIDVTRQTNFFYHAKDHYMEAFGEFDAPDNDTWQIVTFFLVNSSHIDFSSDSQLQCYLDELKEFARQVNSLDMLMFDEPGFTCVYGALPFSSAIQDRFRQKTGAALSENLWKFAVPCTDNSHRDIRISYFKIVQDTMIDFQRKTLDAAKKLWSENVLFGIHDTWHFESADMADMNHGSMDLWKSLSVKSFGFVDLGGINDLHLPDSGYYANYASVGIICKSLGKFGENPLCYNNLWTIGDDEGEGWQSGVMDYCVNTMALMGQRWMPHAYGPVGTVGEEDTFLGSPPLPGYPNHSTWEHYPKWNRRLKAHFASIGDNLPWANIALIYPVEYLYTMPDSRASDIAKRIFEVLLALIDNHYHVDVVSAEMLAKGKWQDGHFHLNQYQYQSIIYPYPEIINEQSAVMLNKGVQQVFYIWQNTDAQASAELNTINSANNITGLLFGLGQHDLRPLQAPANCWVSLVISDSQVVVSIAPSRYSYEYEGELKYKNQSVDLIRSSGLTRVIFSKES